MIIATASVVRPLTPEQSNRMLQTWAELEVRSAEDQSAERLCCYTAADGSSGATIEKVAGPEAAAAVQLETAMPAVLKGMEHLNA